jgi:DNA-binding LacI/PurR family transcriptional regulator
MSIVRVAKYAGVSTATVSRVLNSVPVVSESTVRNVKAAIEAVNYDPYASRRGYRSQARQALRKQHGIIAIIIVGVHRGQIRMPVSDRVIEAITRGAKLRGIRVLLDEMQDIRELGTAIRNKEVDGAVVFMADDAPVDVVLDTIRKHVPAVWAMGGQTGPLNVDHVCENNIAAGCLAHHYLRSLGCHDVAFMTAVPHKRYALQRGQAFAAAATAAKDRFRALVVAENQIAARLFGSDCLNCQSVRDLAETFSRLSPRPTGLFIDRDATAATVHSMLLHMGIHPGHDVRIISCDNDESALSVMYPRPATIDLGAAELGRVILRRLLLRIENSEEPPMLIQTMPELHPGNELPLIQNGVEIS